MVVFACQRDSYLKEFSSSVVSCTPAELKRNVNGKKETVTGFDIILEDTIIFPEGGGQPCDYGLLDDIPVLSARRKGAEAVLFTEKALETGANVKQVIDWARRFDHMQQHSGQHLITAIADEQYGYKTTSWWLGEDISHIELDTPSISEEEIRKLENLVNTKIIEGLAVTVSVYQTGDPYLTKARTRGLPDDHVGDVRLVTIEEVESNMCCGTHVTNLSQLQTIKLMGAEKGKKGKVNLLFLVGGRVLKRMSQMLLREQAITSIINNGPEAHIDLIDKLMKSSKLSTKNLQSVLRDLAELEVKRLKEADPTPKFYALHKKEAELDFINVFIKELNDTNILLLLTIGDVKGAGNAVLYGKENYIAQFGPKMAELLAGKGNGKGNRYQAKVSNMSNRDQVMAFIEKNMPNL